MLGALQLGGHRDLYCQQVYDSFRPLILRLRMSQSSTATFKEVQECFEVLGLDQDQKQSKLLWKAIGLVKNTETKTS